LQKLPKAFHVHSGYQKMTNQKITLSQLEQYLSKAAWILKGPVDASDF